MQEQPHGSKQFLIDTHHVLAAYASKAWARSGYAAARGPAMRSYQRLSRRVWLSPEEVYGSLKISAAIAFQAGTAKYAGR